MSRHWLVLAGVLGGAVACGSDATTASFPDDDAAAGGSGASSSSGGESGGGGSSGDGGSSDGGSTSDGGSSGTGGGSGDGGSSGTGGTGGDVDGGSSGTGGDVDGGAGDGGGGDPDDARVLDDGASAGDAVPGTGPDGGATDSSASNDAAPADPCDVLSDCCADLDLVPLRNNCEAQAATGNVAACEILQPTFCEAFSPTDAGTVCAELADCCDELPVGQRNQCNQVVALGLVCDAVLAAYQSGGSCN